MDKADKIIAHLGSIDKRLAVIEQILTDNKAPLVDKSAHSGSRRPLSITEYVLAKNPMDDNQRTLVLASYMETHKSREDFTVDELRQAFLDGRMKVPGNVSDKIAKLAQKGLIMHVGERDNKKVWRLTMTGVALVEGEFGN